MVFIISPPPLFFKYVRLSFSSISDWTNNFYLNIIEIGVCYQLKL